MAQANVWIPPGSWIEKDTGVMHVGGVDGRHGDVTNPLYDVTNPLYDVTTPLYDVTNPLYNVTTPIYDVYPYI